MAQYDVPEIPEDIVTPSLKPGTMGHLKPYPAVEKHLVPLGFPKPVWKTGKRPGLKNWETC